ncbi:zf-HC2 domain-containing protein [Streptomyces sp. NPDC006879]|uniref:zf-HC2 domain-containing protein n=1 Tax=Streptomyces sp. NPDC006879 TaxID=3364767 RepID=UPI0036B87497
MRGGSSGPKEPEGAGRQARPPRIPAPRRAADDLDPALAPDPTAVPPADPTTTSAMTNTGDGGAEPETRPKPAHQVLRSLLGAWALSACSTEESEAVEGHLTECAPCAEEALRLRDAVGLLHHEETLDLDPLLRSRVLEGCLGKRPARIPVPSWAAPYDTETARLDALLKDIGDAEWHAPVRLKWFQGERVHSRKTTVAGVIGHLLSVDGLITAALGLDDPLGDQAPMDPTDRTEFLWASFPTPATRRIREPWREQSHALVRTVSFAGRGAAELAVPYGQQRALPLQDAFLERAFECWVHAGDIAEAVDYPYEAPTGPHLNGMIDLAARLLPGALAERRRAGLAAPARGLVAAGAPGRTLHLEVEGSGGGNWFIALDSPAASTSAERTVAQIALDGTEFCQLAAGRIAPEDAVAGLDGDREAIRDVLFAAASLSRL